MLRYLWSVDRWRSTAGSRLKPHTVAASTIHRTVPDGRMTIANEPAFQSKANAADATGNRLWRVRRPEPLLNASARNIANTIAPAMWPTAFTMTGWCSLSIGLYTDWPPGRTHIISRQNICILELSLRRTSLRTERTVPLRERPAATATPLVSDGTGTRFPRFEKFEAVISFDAPVQIRESGTAAGRDTEIRPRLAGGRCHGWPRSAVGRRAGKRRVRERR